MITLNRRQAVIGGLATLFAPAIIRTPGLLMPVKPHTDLIHISEISYTLDGKLTLFGVEIVPDIWAPNNGNMWLLNPDLIANNSGYTGPKDKVWTVGTGVYRDLVARFIDQRAGNE